MAYSRRYGYRKFRQRRLIYFQKLAEDWEFVFARRFAQSLDNDDAQDKADRAIQTMDLCMEQLLRPRRRPDTPELLSDESLSVGLSAGDWGERNTTPSRGGDISSEVSPTQLVPTSTDSLGEDEGEGPYGGLSLFLQGGYPHGVGLDPWNQDAQEDIYYISGSTSPLANRDL